jgi:hypothetical protein
MKLWPPVIEAPGAKPETRSMPLALRLLRFGAFAFAVGFGIVAGAGVGWLFILWLAFRGSGGGID